MGFGGEDGGGSYHSIYDSIDHYTRFGDPNFDYGIALAEVCGRLTMRLANADVVPFEFSNFADTLSRYAREVNKLADDLRDETRERNRRLADGTWAMTLDPTEKYVLPQPDKEVPYVNFAPLQNAVARVQASAGSFEHAMRAARARSANLDAATQQRLDEILYRSERALTRTEGLPRRSWFAHQIYAPGFYTGYGVKTLPGIREALEQRNWREADEQVNYTAATLNKFADEIERAAQILKP